MAEFCLECFNKLNGTNYKKRHVSLDWDLCEGCGEIKKCIVVIYYEPLWNFPKKRKEKKDKDEK